jgi:hypothetical protein
MRTLSSRLFLFCTIRRSLLTSTTALYLELSWADLFRLQSSDDNDEAMLNQPTPHSKEMSSVPSFLFSAFSWNHFDIWSSETKNASNIDVKLILKYSEDPSLITIVMQRILRLLCASSRSRCLCIRISSFPFGKFSCPPWECIKGFSKSSTYTFPTF